MPDMKKIIRKVWCSLLGHRHHVFNGQKYEPVTIHDINGSTRIERRLVEREWCGRCGKLLSISFPMPTSHMGEDKI